MKKLLLSLGTIAAVVTPVASVVACGSTSNDLKENMNKVDIHELEDITQLHVKDVFYVVKDKTNIRKLATSNNVELGFVTTKSGKLIDNAIKSGSKINIKLDGRKIYWKVNGKEINIYDKRENVTSIKKSMTSFMQALAANNLTKSFGDGAFLSK